MPGRGVLNCAPPVAPSALVQSRRGVPNSGADRAGAGGRAPFRSSRGLGDRSRCAPKSGATARGRQINYLHSPHAAIGLGISFALAHNMQRTYFVKGPSRRRIPRRARLFVMGCDCAEYSRLRARGRGGKLRHLRTVTAAIGREQACNRRNAGCHVELDAGSGNRCVLAVTPLAPGARTADWQISQGALPTSRAAWSAHRADARKRGAPPPLQGRPASGCSG